MTDIAILQDVKVVKHMDELRLTAFYTHYMASGCIILRNVFEQSVFDRRWF